MTLRLTPGAALAVSRVDDETESKVELRMQMQVGGGRRSERIGTVAHAVRNGRGQFPSQELCPAKLADLPRIMHCRFQLYLCCHAS